MADKYMDLDTLRFILYEVLEGDKLNKYERYADYDRTSLDILIDAVKAFADQELYPYFKEMDEKPAYYQDGQVFIHPQMEKVLKKAAELGLIGPGFEYELGGMQLPVLYNYALVHILDSANNHSTGYAGLTTGAANLIRAFGSEELKAQYIPKMIAGEWGGTMALTEPQAGSSLSDIVSEAVPIDDGSYAISGQKIFISGGDHQFCENFVHLTLARIQGAPAGTKGISLFVVPKKRITTEGTLEDNDVVTAADFPKMGQKGYCTTHLVYGENGNCRGWLVGEANRGLKYMFQMMNEARISVGCAATSMATAAYYASLQYAKERPQGRKINKKGVKDVSEEQVLIIEHPDVRRMLLLQKSIVEGALALILHASRLDDLHAVEEGTASEEAHLLLELLTPIVKSYPAEMGKVSIDNGLQILGGYGFTTDFILQQYYRDIRITSIYEGTTGIQSLDLLGRKIPMENGRAMQLLAKEVMETIGLAHESGLTQEASQLQERMGEVQLVTGHLLKYAEEGDFDHYLADATIYFEFFSTFVIAWQWLKMAVVAQQAIERNAMTYSKEFYEGKVMTMRFYFQYELPKMTAAGETLKSPNSLTVEDFSVDHL
ncbi:MAG: acyl-CoA dehydrogenase [Saprospiraceae bacterium]|nr:acyl-CoA dehydrogenase [Saprospiraceae bacterium]